MALRQAGSSWSLSSGGTITGDLTVNGNVTVGGTGVLTVPVGSAAAPSITFAGNTTDGFSHGGGGIQLCDNGASRVNIGSTVGLATGIPISLAAAHYSMTEMATAPAAVANMARIFAIDDAAKTELAVIFPTGARQQISQEP